MNRNSVSSIMTNYKQKSNFDYYYCKYIQCIKITVISNDDSLTFSLFLKQFSQCNQFFKKIECN